MTFFEEVAPFYTGWSRQRMKCGPPLNIASREEYEEVKCCFSYSIYFQWEGGPMSRRERSR